MKWVELNSKVGSAEKCSDLRVSGKGAGSQLQRQADHRLLQEREWQASKSSRSRRAKALIIYRFHSSTGCFLLDFSPFSTLHWHPNFLPIREKKTDAAKQVQEKVKVKADLQRVLDECGLLEVEISTTTSEIYELDKQIQDLHLQLQNRKEFLSAKQQDFIILSIETISLMEKNSIFEVINPSVRLAAFEVERVKPRGKMVQI
ncbi:unnamed protein product [Dovyalis caffra]|uniref:Uncharacterized protein n=1 Tax=Dovyalis caffra TaxID=77055 RepID=A0AAV1STQ7_9ROSI|nr:unnamed protein product [Dovyalis caffra]